MIILHLRLILHDDLDRSDGKYEWIYCCLKYEWIYCCLKYEWIYCCLRQLIVDKQENDDNDYYYMLVDDTICCYMSTPMTVQMQTQNDAAVNGSK